MPNKTIAAALLALLGCTLAEAQSGGACPCTAGNQYIGTELPGVLNDRMVCVSNGTGGWENQEFHNGSSQRVVDYKLGPGDPVDPSKDIGSYAFIGANVQYNYTGDSKTYSFSVCKKSSPSRDYAFCGASGTSVNIVTVVVSAVSAPSSCNGLMSSLPTQTKAGVVKQQK